MEPITNNFEPPKPSDLNTLSTDSGGETSTVAQLPDGLSAEAVVKYAKARNSAWTKWFGKKIEKIAEDRKLWRNVSEGKQAVGLGIGYSIVESVCARLNSTLLNRPKLVEAVAEEAQATPDLQQIVEDFTNQQLSDKIRKPEKGKACIKSAMLDSACFARSLWVRKGYEVSEATYEVNPMTGENLYVGESPRVVWREDWDFIKVSIANIAFDPHTITKIQESPWVRERSYMSYNDLLRWQNEGRIWDISALKKITPCSLSGKDKDDYEALLKRAGGDTEWRFTYADEKMYQIDEFFADMTYSEGEEVKSVKAHFFIAENEHLIYWEENQLQPKRHPYVSCQGITDPDTILGLALLEAVRPILEQINAYAGKQTALVNWASNPTIFYGSKSGLAGRTTLQRPMGMQQVTDASDIKEFVPNPNTVAVVQNYVQFLIGLAREASGANEQFQGIDGADTATEFQGLAAAAGSRFGDIADTLNQGLIEALACECFWMYQQFGVDGQMVVHPKSEETAGRALTRADLQGVYRFNAVTTAQENYKQKQVADDTAFIGEMINANTNGAFGPGKIYNIPKHLEEISLPLRGAKSGQEMFIEQPPMPMAPGMPQGEVMPPQGEVMPMPEGM